MELRLALLMTLAVIGWVDGFSLTWPSKRGRASWELGPLALLHVSYIMQDVTVNAFTKQVQRRWLK
jgi:hypothetical protein